MKVAPTGHANLEDVAIRLKDLLPKVPGANNWQVDSWRVLEQTLQKAGYSYRIADSIELDECAAFTVPDRNLIVIREDVYDGLFRNENFSRSTVIHELSHIVLKHAATLHRGAIIGQHEFYEDSEWQAKALTAAIMMPVEACRKAPSAHELAELCGTSVQAAGYRLKSLVKRNIIETKKRSSLFDKIS